MPRDHLSEDDIAVPAEAPTALTSQLSDVLNEIDGHVWQERQLTSIMADLIAEMRDFTDTPERRLYWENRAWAVLHAIENSQKLAEPKLKRAFEIKALLRREADSAAS